MEQSGATRSELSMAMDEDLSVFFDTDEFAETITHVETGATFAGTLDLNYANEDMAEVVDAVIVAPAADVAAIQPRHRVEAQGRRFEVLTVRPDGTGLATIMLERG